VLVVVYDFVMNPFVVMGAGYYKVIGFVVLWVSVQVMDLKGVAIA
jgi:hypothetical protein